MGHLVVRKGQLHGVLCQGMGQGVNITRLRISPKEVEGEGSSQFKINGAQNPKLHFANLRFRVGAVRDVHEVADLGRVHLFVLGGDEHGGHAHQLKLLTFNFLGSDL